MLKLLRAITFSQSHPYIAVAIILVSVKFVLISAYGNATPFWDQWVAEADHLYRPWMEGSLKFGDLFVPHNEHRIFTARLLGLALFELNGRVWNPILQMQVNAVLHVLALCLLLFFVSRTVPEESRISLFLFVALIFSIPFGWENTLAGFQSSFYFLLLFSFIFLWSMASHATYTHRWWWGASTGLLCILSLASGALTVLAGAAILVLRRILGQDKAHVAGSAVALLVVTALAAIAMTPTIPFHASLKAQSPIQFLRVFAEILSWPSQKIGIVILVVHAPILLFALRLLHDPSFRTSGHYFTVGLGIWLLGQFLSIAYGRATLFYSSRYQDFFAVGLVMGFASLLTITRTETSQRLVALGKLIWVGVVASALLSSSTNLAEELRTKALQGKAQEANVRKYLCTADFLAIQSKPVPQIPFPNPRQLRGWLDNPTIRSFLPGNICIQNSARQIMTDGEPYCPPGSMTRAFSVKRWDGSSILHLADTQSLISCGWLGSDYLKSSIDGIRVIGSFVKSENDTGLVTLALKRGDQLLFRTGPRVNGQSMLINNGGNGKFYTDVPVSIEWQVMTFNSQALPDAFEVTLIDTGTDWGEWSAIGLKVGSSNTENN